MQEREDVVEDFLFEGCLEDRDEFRRLGHPMPLGFEGERTDNYLAKNFPFLSRSGWQHRIRSGQLQVSGRRIRPSYNLKTGDTLEFFHPHEKEPETDSNIWPIWKQGSVLAVYKPANLPMHENGPYRKNTFAHLLKTQIGEEWNAVHRLDLETSGIVLCASTYLSRRSLAMDLEARKISKTYLAIVNGNPEEPVWIEDGPIGDHKGGRVRIKKWVVEGGLEASTRFTCLDQTQGYSLLRAEPFTGRTNQIRIHAAYKGLPLVGDKLYHPSEDVFIEYHEKGNTPWVVEQTGHLRLCLHAAAIAFRHPESGKICEIECPLPEDMQYLWESLTETAQPQRLEMI